MELPDEIKIGDMFYSVSYHGEIYAKDRPKQRLYGQCDFMDCHIDIVPHPETFKNTLLHESIHAISTFMAADLKEDQIDNMASGIRMFIIDNPELIDLLRR